MMLCKISRQLGRPRMSSRQLLGSPLALKLLFQAAWKRHRLRSCQT